MKQVRAAMIAGCALVALNAPAQGAGFFIQEQGVTGLGRAFAGDVAAGLDASTNWWNPAGLVNLTAPEVQAGVHLLVPNAEIIGATTFMGAAVDSGSSGNPYDPSPVPSAHLAVPLVDGRLAVGLAFGAPFGLTNDYGDDWFGRYDSTQTELSVFNISPTVAVAITDRLSIGGGGDIQFADARLDQAVFAGPMAPDGASSLEGDSWDVGFNIGIQFQATDRLRLGAHYRSAISHDLDGSASLTLPTIMGPVTSRGPGSAGLNLPDIASIGAVFDVSDDARLMGSLTWYGWSQFDAIVARSPVLPGGSSTTTQGYEDTLAASIGGEYDWSDDLTLRAGFQYDPTPTVDQYRTSRTPDGDRYWVTLGASWRASDSVFVDLAYAHIFVSDETINVTRPESGGVQVTGSTENQVDILSVGFRWLLN